MKTIIKIQKVGNNIKDKDEKKISKKIIVHITGEVKNRGIVELEEGARIIDAIEKAGGITEKASLSNINLAYKLEDGMKIKIPNKDEEKEYITKESGNNTNV